MISSSYWIIIPNVLFISAVLLNFVVPQSRAQDQFHAFCFPGCRCNSTVIQCQNLGEVTTEVFRHIRPEIYPNLDTLIITGNNFGDLVNENIFGENIRHKKLSLVNISNNGIRSFGAQTFIGFPRVEYFYLDYNKLNQVIDEQPLNFFTSLKLLSMNHIFGDYISVQARSKFIWQLLLNNHSFIDLNEIILSNNGIDHLQNDTFCNVKGLTQLHLTNNNIKDFNIKKKCLTSLKMLDLAGNHLKTISPNFWNNFESLDTVDFSRNPFLCNCELDSFHKYALREVNTFLNQETTTCAEPPALMGKILFNIKDDTNLCRYGGRSDGFGFFRWFLFLLIAVGFLLVYRFCSKNFAFKSNFGLSTSQLRTPLISEGYSQLKKNDEVPIPVFV